MSGKISLAGYSFSDILSSLHISHSTSIPWHCLICFLVHHKLSNCHIDLSDFSSAALSSVAVATATPLSSALHMKKSSCVNVTET